MLQRVRPASSTLTNTQSNSVLTQAVKDRLKHLLFAIFRTDSLRNDYNCNSYWLEVFEGNTQMYNEAVPVIRNMIEMADELYHSDVHPWEHGRDLIKGMMKAYDTCYKTNTFASYYADIDWDAETGIKTYDSVAEIPEPELKNNNLYLIRLGVRANIAHEGYRFVVSGQKPPLGSEIDTNIKVQSDTQGYMCFDAEVIGIKQIPRENIGQLITRETAAKGTDERLELYDAIYRAANAKPAAPEPPFFHVYPPDMEEIRKQSIAI